MKKGKLIARLIWLAIGCALVVGLLSVFQRLLISGVGFINGLGNAAVEDEAIGAVSVPATVEPEFDASGFAGEPTETPEPEELVVIPVEQTAEELARENEPATEE